MAQLEFRVKNLLSCLEKGTFVSEQAVSACVSLVLNSHLPFCLYSIAVSVYVSIR